MNHFRRKGDGRGTDFPVRDSSRDGAVHELAAICFRCPCIAEERGRVDGEVHSVVVHVVVGAADRKRVAHAARQRGGVRTDCALHVEGEQLQVLDTAEACAGLLGHGVRHAGAGPVDRHVEGQADAARPVVAVRQVLVDERTRAECLH